MYPTEEERMKALRASRNESKKRHWFCDICGKKLHNRRKNNASQDIQASEKYASSSM